MAGIDLGTVGTLVGFGVSVGSGAVVAPGAAGVLLAGCCVAAWAAGVPGGGCALSVSWAAGAGVSWAAGAGVAGIRVGIGATNPSGVGVAVVKLTTTPPGVGR